MFAALCRGGRLSVRGAVSVGLCSRTIVLLRQPKPIWWLFKSPPPLFFFFFFCISLMAYNSHRKSRAQSEKQCRRRSASSGQKTRRGIEGEKPGRRRYLFVFCQCFMTYNSNHKSRAQSEESCRRRSASSGQKTRRGIERRYLFVFCQSFMTYNSHPKSRAQGGRTALAPKAPARGHKTRGCIEGEDPAAAGIWRFFSFSNKFFFQQFSTSPGELG